MAEVILEELKLSPSPKPLSSCGKKHTVIIKGITNSVFGYSNHKCVSNGMASYNGVYFFINFAS